MRKLPTARRHRLGVVLAVSLAISSSVVSAQETSDDAPPSTPVPDDAVPIDDEAAIAVARAFVASGSDLDSITHRVDGSADMPATPLAAESLDDVVSRSEFADQVDDSLEAPEVSVSAVVPAEHNATSSVYLQQTVDGIDVRGAVSVVTVGSRGDVLAANDSFRSASDDADAPSPTPSLSVLDAAAAAVAALDIEPTADFEILQSAGDAEQNHELTASGVSRSTIPARLVYEPIDDKTTRLAWEFLVDSTASNDWWRIRIDAETGVELSRFNLVVHETDPSAHDGHDHGVAHIDELVSAGADEIDARDAFSGSAAPSFTAGGSSNPVADGSSYRVFAAPAESPNHTAPADTRTLVTEPADAVASPYGWHDTNGVAGAETTNTSGNNVDAGTDRNGDNVIDSNSQPSNAGLDFDYPFEDDVVGPQGYIPAVVTNLFYWNNLTHDFLYAYGFDEAAGNFQRNNYGRGGLGGDAVIAEAQDTAGIGLGRETDNANFATPPDGMAPRMQMYVFTDTSPERSSSMDAGVITHEYAHGLSTRLTGGPAYDECLDNAEQQGEGWSDIIALLMTMQGDTAADRKRGIGTYVTGEPTTGLGIRGYRYATGGPGGDNPWTYDSIKSGTFSVHRIGSIWAEFLWEMIWALVDEHGFDPDLMHGTGGNNIATQLIIDGLKLQPCSPGFVDSRDAILQADAINNGGENTCLIWDVFAERGLGVGASQGSSDDRMDGVEDFTVPSSCELSFGVAAPAEVGPGDTITYTLTANNETGGMVSGATIAAPVPSGASYVGGSATCGGSVAGGIVTMPVGSLADGASATCTFDVTAASGQYGSVELDERFESGLSNWRTRRGPSAYSNNWELFTFSSGRRSATADATDGTSDQYLELAQPVAAQANLSMYIEHGFSLEAGLGSTGYDGAVIEASTNGGSTWVDLGPYMTQNGYNRTIASGFGSPIAGRSAFSGETSSLVATRIDLSAFAGDDVLVRFRLASDESEDDFGFWVVPTVRLVNREVRVETSPTLTSSAGTVTQRASTRVSDEPAPPNLGDVVTPVTPVRLLDTRPNGETIDGTQEQIGKRSAGSSLKIPVADRSTVPASAGGVVVNVTAIGPEGTGYFTVHPCLSPVPVASSLNYTAGVNLGNEIVAELDSSGDLCIFTSARTHITADVVGYLPASSAYGAVTPDRLLDTRSSGGLDAGEQVSLQVGGRSGVPSNAGSVIVNVTAIRPATNGFVTSHACLSPRPLSSSLNYTAGYTRGNEIVAELDSSGKMCLFTSSKTNLSVDIVGYLPTGTTVNAVTPSRLLDSRSNGGATIDGESAGIGVRPAGATTAVVIGGRGGVPENASSVLMNITAIRPAGNGYVTVAPCGVPRPNASSLNFVGGVNGGNDIIIGLGDDASICIFNSTATDLSVDVTGYAL
jgi:extracellular elastinolytic metalloproteinase